MCHSCLSPLPAPRLAAEAPLTFFCWPSSFQRTPANSPRFLAPRSSRLRVQKYHIFPYLQQLFSLFFKLFPFALSASEIDFTLFAIIAAARRFFGGNCGFRGLSGGRNAPSSARFCALPARFWRKSARVSRPPMQLRGGTGRTRLGTFLKGTLYIIYGTCPSLSQIFHKSDNVQISNRDSRFRMMTHYKKRSPCFVNQNGFRKS